MTTEVWLIAEDYDDWERNEKPILGVRFEKFHVWENGRTELMRISTRGPDCYVMNMGPKMVSVEAENNRVLIMPGMFIGLPPRLGKVIIAENNRYKLGKQ